MCRKQFGTQFLDHLLDAALSAVRDRLGSATTVSRRYPAFESLHSDPRWTSLMDRLGLPH
jgi:hypothetical protein